MVIHVWRFSNRFKIPTPHSQLPKAVLREWAGLTRSLIRWNKIDVSEGKFLDSSDQKHSQTCWQAIVVVVFLQRRPRSDRKCEQLNTCTEIREENMSVFLLAVSQPESALNYRPPACLELMQWCTTYSWGKLNMKYWLKNWFSCCIIEETLISPVWKMEMTRLKLIKLDWLTQDCFFK